MVPRVNTKAMARRLAPYFPNTLISLARYPNEFFFIRNPKTSKPDSNKSVVFYTTHKCASTLMAKILLRVNSEALGLRYLNLPAYFWDMKSIDSPVYKHLEANAEKYFFTRGYLYGPMRQYIHLPNKNEFNTVLMLRDPRDVLVSGYFSAKFSHRAPLSSQRQPSFYKHRSDLESMGIDDYVLSQADGLESRYSVYRKNIPKNNLLTYECMWNDFSTFLIRLSELMELQLSENLQNELLALARPGEHSKEDVTLHRRKGIPGDYMEKLATPTIKQLNSQFGETLAWMYS